MLLTTEPLPPHTHLLQCFPWLQMFTVCLKKNTLEMMFAMWLLSVSSPEPASWWKEGICVKNMYIKGCKSGMSQMSTFSLVCVWINLLVSARNKVQTNIFKWATQPFCELTELDCCCFAAPVLTATLWPSWAAGQCRLGMCIIEPNWLNPATRKCGNMNTCFKAAQCSQWDAWERGPAAGTVGKAKAPALSPVYTVVRGFSGESCRTGQSHNNVKRK